MGLWDTLGSLLCSKACVVASLTATFVNMCREIYRIFINMVKVVAHRQLFQLSSFGHGQFRPSNFWADLILKMLGNELFSGWRKVGLSKLGKKPKPEKVSSKNHETAFQCVRSKCLSMLSKILLNTVLLQAPRTNDIKSNSTKLLIRFASHNTLI